MKTLRSVLVLLVAVAFGLGLLCPAEDLLETPYDESDNSPFECTPIFLFLAVLRTSWEGPANRAGVSAITIAPGSEISAPAPHRLSDAVPSLEILDHQFRC